MRIKIKNLKKLIKENHSLFEDKNDLKGIYSDNFGEYNVKDVVKWAEKNTNVKKISIKKLLHNLEPSSEETGSDIPGSDAFVSRAKKTDLSYPIIVVPYDDGLWILDGVHRLWKAHNLGHKRIKARLVPGTALCQFKM